MKFFADLHIHSRFSRAVSPRMDLPHLAEGAKLKGLQIMGTGDFTHPVWLKELKQGLQETGFQGLYYFKDDEAPEGKKTLFMLTAEVATFYSTPSGVKKVHHVVHAPSFEAVEQINEAYARRGSLEADGRPMFGKTSPAALVEETLSACPEAFVIPAHAWTPWFGVLGDKSGYNSLEEAYEDQAKHIIALETGMSSDPAMNWRLSRLDKYALVSNSDAHSPSPLRLGRECNVFDFEEPAYDKIFDAIKKKDKKKFLFTIETSPSYGKYHFDGHRDCGFSCGPEESTKLEEKCPKCGRPLTVGVMHRVEELADRDEGFKPEHAVPFKTLLPLQELVAVVQGGTAFSKKVYATTMRLIERFGNEFNVLLEAPRGELALEAGERLADAVLLAREENLEVKPGFDGEYGKLVLPGKPRGQKGLADYA